MRLKLFFSALAVAAIALTGCNKQTELEINYGKTATVQGKVTLIQTGQEDKAAADVKVYAQIPYNQLVSNNNNTGNKLFETTTDSEGKYSFELPVIDNGTDVTIFTESKVTEDVIYNSGNSHVRMLPNMAYIRDLTMNVNSIDATKEIKLSGTVKDYNNSPLLGIEVIAKYAGKFYTITTDDDGKYTFMLPYLRNDYAYIFTNSKSDNTYYYPVTNYNSPVRVEEFPNELTGLDIFIEKQYLNN